MCRNKFVLIIFPNNINTAAKRQGLKVRWRRPPAPFRRHTSLLLLVPFLGEIFKFLSLRVTPPAHDGSRHPGGLL